jgi:hypothetical protein
MSAELERSTVMDAQMGKTIECEVIPFPPGIQEAISDALQAGHYLSVPDLLEQLRLKEQELRGVYNIIEKQMIQISDLTISIRRLKRGEPELEIHRNL